MIHAKVNHRLRSKNECRRSCSCSLIKINWYFSCFCLLFDWRRTMLEAMQCHAQIKRCMNTWKSSNSSWYIIYFQRKVPIVFFWEVIAHFRLNWGTKAVKLGEKYAQIIEKIWSLLAEIWQSFYDIKLPDPINLSMAFFVCFQSHFVIILGYLGVLLWNGCEMLISLTIYIAATASGFLYFFLKFYFDTYYKRKEIQSGEEKNEWIV